MLAVSAKSQCDTVTNIAVNSITATTATITYTASAQATSYYVVVRDSATNANTFTTTTSLTSVNVTGLVSNRRYLVYVGSLCPVDTSIIINSVTVPKKFTTVNNIVVYTPMNANGYQYRRGAFDSTFHIPFGDTALNRGITRPGALMTYSGDSSFYWWNGAIWQPVTQNIETLTALINEKVDSLTFSSGILYYWVDGVSTGISIEGSTTVITLNPGTTSWTFSAGTIIEKVAVIETTDITVDIGTSMSGTELFEGMPVNTGVGVVQFDYYPLSSGTIYFTGVTVNTTIKIYIR